MDSNQLRQLFDDIFNDILGIFYDTYISNGSEYTKSELYSELSETLLLENDYVILPIKCSIRSNLYFLKRQHDMLRHVFDHGKSLPSYSKRTLEILCELYYNIRALVCLNQISDLALNLTGYMYYQYFEICEKLDLSTPQKTFFERSDYFNEYFLKPSKSVRPIEDSIGEDHQFINDKVIKLESGEDFHVLQDKSIFYYKTNDLIDFLRECKIFIQEGKYKDIPCKIIYNYGKNTKVMFEDGSMHYIPNKYRLKWS